MIPEHKLCLNNLDIVMPLFIISQNKYDLPKRTIRANGKTHEVFKSNNFRDFQRIFQDKTSMDMNL